MREKHCESSECGQPLCLHFFLTEPQSVHTGEKPCERKKWAKAFYIVNLSQALSENSYWENTF